MEEEWRPIVDYPNYEVSSFGNIRNSKTGRIMKQGITKIGYCKIALYGNIWKLVHRLVAKSFIPNPENKPEVDHIDRNPTNNIVTNLRWVTTSENQMNRNYRDRELFGIVKQKNQYKVQISINQKQIYFGTRSTLEEAIQLRDETLIQLGQ